MGVTLTSKTKEADMGYGHFTLGLRRDIAYSISDKLGKAFDEFTHAILRRIHEPDVDRLNEICKEIGLDDEIQEFLFIKSDCSDTISPECCEKILSFYNDKIKDDTCYGYSRGGKNTATAADIKDILRECVELHIPLEWY